jgi:transcriptional regulator with XRE-family HTH domain
VHIIASQFAASSSGRLEPEAMHFGRWLKAMRDVKEFSQRDLSGLADTSLFTIQKAERGDTPAPLSKKTRRKIAKAFDLDAESFVKMWREGRDIYGAFWTETPVDATAKESPPLVLKYADDPDVYRAVQRFAEENELSLEEAASQMILARAKQIDEEEEELMRKRGGTEIKGEDPTLIKQSKGK